MIAAPRLDLTACEAQARLFKTLTHPARLAILTELHRGEQCVCHLEAHLGYRQAYLSQQLAVMRAAGLIEDRREGWNVFYRVVQPGIFAVLDAACAFLGQAVSGLPGAADCPCPKCSGGNG